MVIQSDVQRVSTTAVKLGVVYLGRICEKHKYTLLDERDIPFVRNFTLEATLVVDPNGTGANIYATARRSADDPPVLFHELLWKQHYGSLEAGCKIVHKNGITVDNRITNLGTAPIDAPFLNKPKDAAAVRSPEEDDSIQRSIELYRVALSQLPPLDRRLDLITRAFDGNGELMTPGDESAFFECRRLACCAVQPVFGPSTDCRRCRTSRYCSAACLEMDRDRHKHECVAVPTHRQEATKCCR